MKSSKEYSQKLRKLYRSLRRTHPRMQSVTYDEPVDALVYAVLSEKISETQAQSAIKGFSDYFIDLNDLRVSRAEEVIEVLGADTPVNREITSTLNKALRAVFDKYHMVSLKALKKVGKKQARQMLEKMNVASPFVVDYCMLTSLQGHAVPLTEKMIDYLKRNELVYPDAGRQQIAGFLAKQVPAENAYEFYALLRRESESDKGAGKKKTTRKTQTGAISGSKKKTTKTTKTARRKK
ncbi:MAG TPA: hypothetical protein VMW16_14945 [Sedimentisphaerales bacterium]|nr:hypothetical protein [Sedimentisphaerales bacterium]